MQTYCLKFLLAGALILGPLGANADPLRYSAKAIHGQVLDRESGEPLDGVIVVAKWPLVQEETFMGATFYRQKNADNLKFVEVMTNKDGRYVLPAWGPTMRPFFSHLDRYSPEIMYFKAGYYPEHRLNDKRREEAMDSELASYMDGVPVQLQKFTGKPINWPAPTDGNEPDGSLLSYARQIRFLESYLDWGAENDQWKLMPHMIMAIEKEKTRVRKESPKGREQYEIRGISSLDTAGGDRVWEFLREFEK